jgi:hypothetical protein
MVKAAAAVLAAAQMSVLDGARVPDLLGRLKAGKGEARCLFQGDSARDLVDVAPHLVALDPQSSLTQSLFTEGWGASWGVHLTSTASLDEVRSHFRRFLMVLDHTGKSFYFRLYDPRVLRVFLPTCDAEQLKTLFGPIDAFLVEDEDPSRALMFSLDGESLKTKVLPATGTIRWKGKASKVGAEGSATE